jgi:EAL and modified HD-GYP domain-containing signal transduction protein
MMGRSVPIGSMQLLQVLSLISSAKDLDLRELESAIAKDVGLSLKLIRYSNTARFAGNISSLRECMIRLGSLETRRFLSILAFPQLCAQDSPELVEQAVLRGRMCENLASAIRRDDLRPQAFLVGMFSLLEAIMRVPLPEIVDALSLSPDLKTALLEDPAASTLGRLLHVVKSYEAADMASLNGLSEDLDIGMPQMLDAYLSAIQ